MIASGLDRYLVIISLKSIWNISEIKCNAHNNTTTTTTKNGMQEQYKKLKSFIRADMPVNKYQLRQN